MKGLDISFKTEIRKKLEKYKVRYFSSDEVVIFNMDEELESQLDVWDIEYKEAI
jgi:hypothetical protein